VATAVRSNGRLIDDNRQTQAVIALEDILEELVGEVMGAPGGQTLQTRSTVSWRTYQDQVRSHGLVRKSG
jgi:Mg2+/Co2+ transporter CorB